MNWDIGTDVYTLLTVCKKLNKVRKIHSESF